MDRWREGGGGEERWSKPFAEAGPVVRFAKGGHFRVMVWENSRWLSSILVNIPIDVIMFAPIMGRHC